MVFDNFFKRKEREQRRLKQEALEKERERELQRRRQAVAQAQAKSAIKTNANERLLTIEECLSRVHGVLQTVRKLQPNDIRAFPLLNESQRLLVQLRQFVGVLPLPDKTPWTFQVKELEDEVQRQTDRILSSASSRPAPIANKTATAPQPTSRERLGSWAAPSSMPQPSSKMTPSASARATSTMPLSTPSRPILQRASSKGSAASPYMGMPQVAFQNSSDAVVLKPLPANGTAPKLVYGDVTSTQPAGRETSFRSAGQVHGQQGAGNSINQPAPDPQQQAQQAGWQVAPYTDTVTGSHRALEAASQHGAGSSTKAGDHGEDMFSGLDVSDPASHSQSAAVAVATSEPPASTNSSVSALTAGSPAATAPGRTPAIKKKTRGIKVGAYGREGDSDGSLTGPESSLGNGPSQKAAEGTFPWTDVAAAAVASAAVVATATPSGQAAWTAPAAAVATGSSFLAPAADAGSEVALQRGGSWTSGMVPTSGASGPSRLSSVSTAGTATAAVAAASTKALQNGTTSFSESAAVATPAASEGRRVRPSDVAAAAAAASASMQSSGDSWARQPIKKKTRGIKVGYGNLEDPTGPLRSPNSALAFNETVPNKATMVARQLSMPQQRQQSSPGFLPERPLESTSLPLSQQRQQLQQQHDAGSQQQLPASQQMMPVMPSPAVIVGVPLSPAAAVAAAAVASASAAGMQQRQSSTPVEQLQAYLSSLSGSLEMCQQAAVTAATAAVQQLAAAAEEAAQREAAVQERWHGSQADLATCAQAVAILQQQQEEAAAKEDYEQAAALDPRLSAVAAKAAALEAGAAQLQQEAAQFAGRREEILAQQEGIWRAAADYLHRLRESHLHAGEAATARFEQELSILEARYSQVDAAIAEAESSVQLRRAELRQARDKVESRVRLAAGSVYGQHEQLVQQQASLEAEVKQLRAVLAEKERQLADTSRQLEEATAVKQQLSLPFEQELAAVQEQEEQLAVQEAGLEQQAGMLRQCHAKAAERRQAFQEQHARMQQQAKELLEAATQLEARAAAVRHPSGSEQGAAAAGRKVQGSIPQDIPVGSGAQRGGSADGGQPQQDRQLAVEASGQLQASPAEVWQSTYREEADTSSEGQAIQAVKEEAVAKLAALRKRMDDMTSELAALSSRQALLEADVAAMGSQVAAATQLLAELEAGKKAAAARRDFKEAARLSTEAKAAAVEVDRLRQQLSHAQAAAAGASMAVTAKGAELAQLKAQVLELQGDAALGGAVHDGMRMGAATVQAAWHSNVLFDEEVR